MAALSAAQAGKLNAGTLLWAAGFGKAANNGLKSVNADIASGATDISVAQSLTTEAAGARLSLASYRVPSSGAVTWAYDSASKQATLQMTGLGTTLLGLGLTPGQFVHIGSIAAAGNTSIVNAFQNTAANDMHGYARVASISANRVVFDKTDAALKFSDSTSPTTAVDILFGEFIRNVSTGDSDYIERSFQFEAEFPNLGTGGASEYQYAKGNFCNTLGFNVPLADKATLSLAFIGTDTENPTPLRKTGAARASSPAQVAAFNTSADIVRLRITETDEDGLTTDFKSLTLTLNNNVSPEKVVGRLGAKFMNAGNLEVDIETQLVFTNGDVVNKIRDNETVTMDFVLKNGEGVIAVDIPSMTLGGGGREYPVNESVLINTTGQAFQDDGLGTSLGVSIIPVPLP